MSPLERALGYPKNIGPVGCYLTRFRVTLTKTLALSACGGPYQPCNYQLCKSAQDCDPECPQSPGNSEGSAP